MTPQEIEKAIKVQQEIQMSNPPSSKIWEDASNELHRLIELLTGKPPKDAWGKQP
jgi:hypothetical protein